MKLVIDIPDNLYDTIAKDEYGVHQGRVYDLIRNGTPLPKGHGRLIDADKFVEDYDCLGYIEDMKVEDFNRGTPTVIEADKEKK